MGIFSSRQNIDDNKKEILINSLKTKLKNNKINLTQRLGPISFELASLLKDKEALEQIIILIDVDKKYIDQIIPIFLIENNRIKNNENSDEITLQNLLLRIFTNQVYENHFNKRGYLTTPDIFINKLQDLNDIESAHTFLKEIEKIEKGYRNKRSYMFNPSILNKYQKKEKKEKTEMADEDLKEKLNEIKLKKTDFKNNKLIGHDNCFILIFSHNCGFCTQPKRDFVNADFGIEKRVIDVTNDEIENLEEVFNMGDEPFTVPRMYKIIDGVIEKVEVDTLKSYL